MTTSYEPFPGQPPISMPFVDIERVDLALSEQEKQECIRLGKEQAAPLLRVLDPNKLFARRFAAAKAARERNSVSIGTQTVEVNETASTRGRNNKRKASEEVAQGRENKALKLSKDNAVGPEGTPNLILKCGEKAWSVHKKVLFEASAPLLKAFVYSNDPEAVTIENCLPAAVHATLNFLYSKDYNAEQYCKTGNSYPIFFHTQVYSLATKYEIQTLGIAALVKFSCLLDQNPDPPGLKEVIYEIFRTNSGGMEALRTILLDSMKKLRLVRRHLPDGRVANLMEAHPFLETAQKYASALPKPSQTANTSTPAAPRGLDYGNAAPVAPPHPTSNNILSTPSNLQVPASDTSKHTLPRSAGLKAMYNTASATDTVKKTIETARATYYQTAGTTTTSQAPANNQQVLATHVTKLPWGNIEYLCRVCMKVSKGVLVTNLPERLFACPKCGVAKTGLVWDSIRKPRGWEG